MAEHQTKDHKKDYELRLKRVNDAIALKEPDQVPCSPEFMTFPFLWAGYTMAEVNYDLEKAKDAVRKYMNHFQPDMGGCAFGDIFCGQMGMLDKLGVKWMQWAGQKGAVVDDHSIFQFIEKEYLEEDEYDALLSDLTGWMLTRYQPRTMGIMEPLANLNFPAMRTYGFLAGTLAFCDPGVLKSVQTLAEVGQEYAAYLGQVAAFNQEVVDMGFVQKYAGTTTTAFDNLSDCLRGTIGTMTDMMTQPENVKKAIETLYPGTLYGALAQAEHSNGRLVMIPLHKGMDTFLSDEQYKEFYWDTLLRLVNGLIDHGLTPWVYSEGPYDSRIECLMDLPKGKCLLHFEKADMRRAKKLLGNVACLSGGISSHMLMYGTKEQVVDKVKENIDILAPGGGYIFDLGDSMGDCKPELVEAMFDTVRTYGKY